jgi:hypothetical protein
MITQFLCNLKGEKEEAVDDSMRKKLAGKL